MLNNIPPIKNAEIYFSSSEEEIDTAAQNLMPAQSTTPTLEEDLSSMLSISQLQLENKLIEAVQVSFMQGQKAYGEQAKLTLDEAEKLLQRLIGKKIFKFLSPINILFVEIIKVLQSLEKDAIFTKSELIIYQAHQKNKHVSIKAILQKLSSKIHKLNRFLREYSGLNEGVTLEKKSLANLLRAQEMYDQAYLLYHQLEAANQAINSHKLKQLMGKLKNYLDVFYYICYQEDFLLKCTHSISPCSDTATTVFTYVPNTSHVDFYLDSLNVCFSSLVYFQSLMHKNYYSPIDEVLAKIKTMQRTKGAQALQPVIEALENYVKWIKGTCQPFITSAQKMIIKAKTDRQNAKLLNCFQNQTNNCGLFQINLKEIATILGQMHMAWGEFNYTFSNHQFITSASNKCAYFKNEFLKAKKALGKSIFKNQEGRQLKDLFTKLETSIFDHLTSSINIFVIEPTRMPMLTFQEMACFGSIINDVSTSLTKLQRALANSLPKEPSSAFGTFDLIWQAAYTFMENIDANSPQGLDQEYVEVTEHLFKNIASMLIDFDLIGQSPGHQEESRELLDNIHTQLSAWTNFSLAYANSQLMNGGAFQTIFESLKDYLNHIRPFDTLRSHMCATLTSAINTKDEVSSHDIPLIKKHFHLLANSISIDQVTEYFNQWQKTIKSIRNNAPPESWPFWHLAHKNVLLAKNEALSVLENDRAFNKDIQACQNLNDMLGFLHGWKAKNDKHKPCLQFCMDQLTLINFKNVKIYKIQAEELLASTRLLWSKRLYLTLTIEDLVLISKEPAPLAQRHKPLKKKIKKAAPPLAKAGAIKPNFNRPQENQTQLPLPIMALPVESLMEKDVLQALKDLPLNTLPLESKESYFFRFSKRQELIQNMQIYLALIEEHKTWPPLDNNLATVFQLRGQTDHLLLLEATEKIALTTLSLSASNQSDTHLICMLNEKRPLIYSHDGELLLNYIKDSDRHWFLAPELMPAIQSQNHYLKRVFWFQSPSYEINGLSSIQKCCQHIWQEISHLPSKKDENPLYPAAKIYVKCQSHFYNSQRHKIINKPTKVMDVPTAGAFKESLDLFMLQKNWSRSCQELVDSNHRALECILDMLFAFQACENLEKFPPLSFAMRSAEMQVSILSITLQLTLSQFRPQEDGTHPLFLDCHAQEIGRPLCYTHNVDKLWQAVKTSVKTLPVELINMLDSNVHLFTGDPRYVFPNKTAFSMPLNEIYEKVCLLQKILSDGFFTLAEKRLLQQYIGQDYWQLSSQQKGQILKASIQARMQEQQNKTHLAIYLAFRLLKHLIN